MGLTLRLHGFTSLGHSSSFLVVRGTVDVFTVCHDVVYIGQVLVVGTCVLMQHCETIHSFLRFLHSLRGLQEEFDPADVDGGCIKYLVTLAKTKDMLSSRLFEKARHRPGMKLIESNLSL